jgi:hypothetical protein
MNNGIYPIFQITDWVIAFEELELRDEMRVAQIGQIKANTALTWLKSGFSVRVNSRGELEVWGEGKSPNPTSPAGWKPPQPERIGIESDATGQMRERTGAFAPKPAGDQAEVYNQDSVPTPTGGLPATSDTPGIYNPRHSSGWVQPAGIRRRHRG